MNPQRNQLKLMLDIERAKLDAEESNLSKHVPTTVEGIKEAKLRLDIVADNKYRLTMLQTKVNAGKYD